MSQTNPVFKDKSGRKLKGGDFVIYGHALGRCAGLRYGKVIQVQWSKGYDGDDKIPKLKVHGVDDDWEHNEPRLCSKSVALGFPQRVLKIDRDQLPNKFSEMLDAIEVVPDDEIPAVEAKQNRLDNI